MTDSNLSPTGITWIIIILIVVSILVTCSEVIIRFGILSSSKKPGEDPLLRFANLSPGMVSDL